MHADTAPVQHAAGWHAKIHNIISEMYAFPAPSAVTAPESSSHMQQALHVCSYKVGCIAHKHAKYAQPSGIATYINLEHVQADAFTGDIWVVDLCLEGHFWRFCRVRLWELHVTVKRNAGHVAFGGKHGEGPLEDIVSDWARINVRNGVPSELL